jgi:hypothetical protein
MYAAVVGRIKKKLNATMEKVEELKKKKTKISHKMKRIK